MGEIAVWGDDSSGQITGKPGPADNQFDRIAPGGNAHILAIRKQGSLKLWGGIGLSPDKLIPPLPTLSGQVFTRAALGLTHLVALRDNNTVWSYGHFYPGGDPKAPPMFAQEVAAAAGFSLAIDMIWKLHQWPIPAPGSALPPSGDFIKVAARHDYAIALSADHRHIYGWGGSVFPPTGMRDQAALFVGWEFDPVGKYYVYTDKSDNLSPFCDIAAGNIQKDMGNVPHILALRNDGTVSGWGLNRYGETQAPPGCIFKKVAAGLSYSLGIDANDHLRFWGFKGFFAPIGPGGLLQVPAGTFVSVGAGPLHAAAVATPPT
jgi:alpha-tubulin suppressor-like RCC1 family protein